MKNPASFFQNSKFAYQNIRSRNHFLTKKSLSPRNEKKIKKKSNESCLWNEGLLKLYSFFAEKKKLVQQPLTQDMQGKYFSYKIGLFK